MRRFTPTTHAAGAALALGLAAGTASADQLIPLGDQDIRALRVSATHQSTSDIKVASKVKNLSDGITHTPWIGEGEVAVEVEFGSTRYLAGLNVVAGCVGSNRTYAEFGRPTELVIESDERKVVLPLSGTRALQLLRIEPPLPARSVTLRVSQSVPGHQPSMCLGELGFLEGDAVSGMNEATRERLDAEVARFEDPSTPKSVVDGVAKIGPGAVPRLTAVLETGSPLAAGRAIRALRRIGSSSAAKALLAYWPKAPRELRIATLGALARCADGQVLPLLAKTMVSEDLGLADAAAKAMGHLGAPAVDRLAEALKSPHEDVQLRALRALGGIRDPRVMPLALPFANAAHSSVRAAAARALAASESATAIPYLERLAADAHPVVRVAVGKALVAFPGADATRILGGLMRDRDGLVARVAINRMARRTDGERQLSLYFAEPMAHHGELAVTRLGAMRTPGALQVMVDALRRGESRYRQSLREAVGGFGAAGVESLVSAALTDDRLRLDAEAVVAETDAAGLAAATALLRANLSTPPSFLVRGVGRRANPASLAVLDEVWDSGLTGPRLDVVKAWGNYPSMAVATRVMGALHSPDPAIRAEAATAAGLAEVNEAIPTLLAALTDRNIATERVIDALSRLGDDLADDFMEAAFFAHETRMEVRLAILHACHRTESLQCIGVLARAGSHPNADVRSEALRLIAGR